MEDTDIEIVLKKKLKLKRNRQEWVNRKMTLL